MLQCWWRTKYGNAAQARKQHPAPQQHHHLQAATIPVRNHCQSPCLQASCANQTSNRREDIKCPVRVGAINTIDGIQRINHKLATRIKAFRLEAMKSSGPLSASTAAYWAMELGLMLIATDLRHGLDQRLQAGGIADPPACHAIRSDTPLSVGMRSRRSSATSAKVAKVKSP